ncbi:MAG: bifunctional phosphopantothenoylcysteine decarboxylase/phosphopantothenate--cysteine ligase CoaBC [Flavobacteriaceae bacterium]|nr:bifunctional phosphopantothenoylcysteine decarboxylase/phosphopantothenate--cysteine ligase CoaBC [Flavobacteriaceae bacterium]
MSVLRDKHILLGISAGIAAYKTAFLVRNFIKSGAEVRVVMTPASKEFVTPLTLSTLSKNAVYSAFYTEEGEKEWNNHVDLALWADFIVIAPATANTISKMVKGTCDNLLIAVYLSAKSPVYFAPSMDLDMYQHPSTQDNIKTLQQYGNIFIPPGHGELASGLVGEGRMAEPEEIVSFIENDLLSRLPLRNKKVLITAGPTYEAIDPVRFIGNYSSGKMGFALAEEAADLGADVKLITGPTALKTTSSGIERIDVTSADEMYDAVHKHFSHMDVAIFAAAVADYKPIEVAAQKIKKTEGNLSIALQPTPDILASAGKIKGKQFLVGFALETDNELANAKSKLKKKNLDMIVLNSLKDEGAGFRKDTNKITIIDKNEKVVNFDMKNKDAVAADIFNEILKQTNE